MIDRIVIENFKSLRLVDLSLGRMNLFIGANASGKSNFLDALRVLQGIGNGFTISEILDGKPKEATSEIWDGIRGGSSKACFVGAEADSAVALPEQALDEVTIEAHGTFETHTSPLWKPLADSSLISDPRLRTVDSWPTWMFLIAFSPAICRITRERFSLGQHAIYDFPTSNGPDQSFARYHSGISGKQGSFRIDNHRPVLGQFADLYDQRLFDDFPREHPIFATRTATLLANTQRVDPTPARLRNYSEVPGAQRMGDHGENFAALIHTLCQNDKTKAAYLSWLRQLRPEEVNDVGILSGALGEPLFMLRENGREFPAPVLSDGTLRFAALVAAFFQPDMPGLMTIEEIENGIHASRVRLLLELLRSQATAAKTQIVATSHSATVLDWLREQDYKTTFFCKRDELTGESKIRALVDVPRFMDVVRKKPVSELFSEGWLETVL